MTRPEPPRDAFSVTTTASSCAQNGCGRTPLTGHALCEEHLRDAIGPELAGRLKSSAATVQRSQARVEKVAARTARLERMIRSNPGDAQKVCPHCQVRGNVTSRRVRRKKGISGGKATGAILTAGMSLLATGLSRKETVTEMHCRNCGTTWTV